MSSNLNEISTAQLYQKLQELKVHGRSKAKGNRAKCLELLNNAVAPPEEKTQETVPEFKTKRKGNPSSLSAFNQFLKTYREENKDNLDGKSFNEIRTIASQAYREHKTKKEEE